MSGSAGRTAPDEWRDGALGNSEMAVRASFTKFEHLAQDGDDAALRRPEMGDGP